VHFLSGRQYRETSPGHHSATPATHSLKNLSTFRKEVSTRPGEAGNIHRNMGDRSPKANQKQSKQKNAKNSASEQKKKDAATAKAAKR
jgi:hypothetical protein